MDLSVNVIFVIVVSVLQLAISNVAAVDYLVGDEKGWTTNVDYRAWAKGKIFHVGDRLVFKYPAGDHNVVQVKRDEFKYCMASPKSLALTSGHDEIELTSAGRKLYISSVRDHCILGNQKLAITVFPAPSIDYWKRFPEVPAPAPTIDIWKLFFPPAPAPFPIDWKKLFFPPMAAPAPVPFPIDWKKLFFPPMPAPAPAPFPFDWKKLFFPPTTAPAPAPFAFDWTKFFFPPTAAPAPTPIVEFPWKKYFMPPLTAPAPAPSTDYTWIFKLMFPPFPAPAPAPTANFFSRWMLPPMTNAPYFSPPNGMNQKE
ncbi:hypothetical protein Leryth_010383 [Lithospermum erythrorhizon]|nr:hypothetical protein Leryth_010383 [Lithospermum erythrorhizon]